MKKFTWIIAFLFCAGGMLAQQEHQFTQFMHTKLPLNPGYAGSKAGPALSALYRKQWIGFDGAPTTGLVSFHTGLLANRIGFGLTLANYDIGLYNTWSGTMAYSYQIGLTENSTLRLGISAGLKSVGINFDDPSIIIRDQQDAAVPLGTELNQIRANFGVGAYLDFQGIYFGVSSPNIIPNELGVGNIDPQIGRTEISKERPHIYAMTGADIPVSNKLDLRPEILAKYVEGAPFDMDMNLTLFFNKTIGAGVSYRLGGEGSGESFDFLLFCQIGNLGLGTAYDFTTTEISNHSNGSIEVVITYDFKKEQENIENPRIFF